ncbi:hypothetical protein M7I_7809 [Glarea lozoyensis 74030]|uniref:Uncharacterized protein n=1 Tax=Glarea lozoyensis (strain ATCC 74030 / MF5533) TaxID=1104152 RepID=H0EYB0_GLAL7|nr:hypothetical protein M7I_7809 [Glarea lozoyensis 74030]
MPIQSSNFSTCTAVPLTKAFLFNPEIKTIIDNARFGESIASSNTFRWMEAGLWVKSTVKREGSAAAWMEASQENWKTSIGFVSRSTRDPSARIPDNCQEGRRNSQTGKASRRGSHHRE